MIKHGKLKTELQKLRDDNAALEAAQEKREQQIKELDPPHRRAENGQTTSRRWG